MQKLLDESGLMRGLLANVDKGPFTLFVPTDRAFNQFLLTVMGGVSKGLARLDTNKSELYQVHTLTILNCVSTRSRNGSISCSKIVHILDKPKTL